MGNSGRKPEVGDQEIINILANSQDPVLSTSELTEELPIGRSATYKRLKSLRDRGIIKGKSIGGRNNVWWVPDDSEEE